MLYLEIACIELKKRVTKRKSDWIMGLCLQVDLENAAIEKSRYYILSVI
jgi:hypothetical protein